VCGVFVGAGSSCNPIPFLQLGCYRAMNKGAITINVDLNALVRIRAEPLCAPLAKSSKSASSGFVSKHVGLANPGIEVAKDKGVGVAS